MKGNVRGEAVGGMAEGMGWKECWRGGGGRNYGGQRGGEENDKAELQSNEVTGKGRWTTLGPGGGKGRWGLQFQRTQCLLTLQLTTQQFTDKLCGTEENMMVYWIA